jgi:hypothetical protein
MVSGFWFSILIGGGYPESSRVPAFCGLAVGVDTRKFRIFCQDFFSQTYFFVRWVRWVPWLFDGQPLLRDNAAMTVEEMQTPSWTPGSHSRFIGVGLVSHGPHASARVTARVAPQRTPINIDSARVHGSRRVRGSLPNLNLSHSLNLNLPFPWSVVPLSCGPWSCRLVVRGLVAPRYAGCPPFCLLLRSFARDILPASFSALPPSNSTRGPQLIAFNLAQSR